MNRILFLIGLIYCISTINCSLPNFTVENLCSKDVFNYENSNGKYYKVNTIVRSQLNITFLHIDYHTIQYAEEELIKFFENKKDAIRMAALLKTFDNKIQEIYSHEYLNNPQKFNNIEKDLKLIKNLHLNIEYLRYNYMKAFFPRFLIGSNINHGRDFVKSLDYYRRNKLEPTVLRLFQFDKQISQVKNHISELKLYNLEYAFGEDAMIEVFTSNEIIQKNKFIFNKAENNLYSNGTIVLDVIMPYHNTNYTEVTKDCVPTEELPKFFH